MTSEVAVVGLVSCITGALIGAVTAAASAMSVWRKSCKNNGAMMRDIVKSTKTRAEADKDMSSLYGIGFADGLDLGRKIVEGMGTMSGLADLEVSVVDGDIKIQAKS